MPTFPASDGTELAYHVSGEGAPLICLPGGPMQDSVYLGDLGGLNEHRQLIMLDLRGTGASATPENTSSYRCDRLVEDVEALREHLGLDRMDLLAHSAGVNIAALYSTRHADRVNRLAFVTPSSFAVGIQPTGETRRAVARLRADEPWFPAAYTALEAITTNRASDGDWTAIAPFFYGRWDEAARAHQAAEADQKNQEAAEIFGSEGAFDPDATRTALAGLHAPVLFVAGEVDLGACASAVSEYAELVPNSVLVVLPGAGHFPWLDDPDRFASTIAAFLDKGPLAPTAS